MGDPICRPDWFFLNGIELTGSYLFRSRGSLGRGACRLQIKLIIKLLTKCEESIASIKKSLQPVVGEQTTAQMVLEQLTNLHSEKSACCGVHPDLRVDTFYDHHGFLG